MSDTKDSFKEMLWSREGLLVAVVSGTFTVIGTAILLIGGTVKYFVVDRPLSLQVHRLTTAQADIAEQQRHPAIALTPTITQSDSVEDVREIRLRVIIQNVGGTDAELRKLELIVSNGVPTEDASQDLTLTRRFFLKRHGEKEEGQDDPIVPIKQRNDGYIDNPKEDPTHDCRHGRVFAISNDSPHIQWFAAEHADQIVETVSVLKPKQSAMHEFVFVLTEYPNQHHRQWLRFEVKAYWDDMSGPRAGEIVEGILPMNCEQSEMIVPGMPLTATLPQDVGFTIPDEQTGNTKGQVWRADAPTITPRNRLIPRNQRNSR
jgi:hypothetical protein